MKIQFLASLLLVVLVSCAKPGSNRGPGSNAGSDKTTGRFLDPEDMVAWWPGDGNAHEIIGRRNGISVNDVRFEQGEVAEAFSFDGDSRIEVPDDPIWTLSDKPFTIELWVNFNQVNSSVQALIAHDDGTGHRNKWIFYWALSGPAGPDEPGLRFLIDYNYLYGDELAPVPIFAHWMPVPGQWYQVAVTRQDQEYSLYINGVQVANETDSSVFPDPVANLTLGWAEPEYTLDGLLDEVQIYNRALTAAEIESIFAAGTAGMCKNVNGREGKR